MLNPVEIAMKSVGCSQSELARRLGVHRSVVSVWKRRGVIPIKAVPRLSSVTGVPPHILRPDFFPRPVEVVFRDPSGE